MPGYEHPDKPSFDVVEFEAAAIARADEFVQQISRLAILETADHLKRDWATRHEAFYELDGVRVEVIHGEYYDDPTKTVSTARVTQKPIEITGTDGHLRKATYSRIFLYRTYMSEIDIDEQQLQQELDGLPMLTSEQLSMGVAGRLSDRAIGNFEHMVNETYKPAELVSATSRIEVERKLPLSPGFRAEHYSEDMSPATMESHKSALFKAHHGPPAPYNIPEHEALMAYFGRINPAETKPTWVQDHFHEYWTDHPDTMGIWMPRE